MKFIAMILVVYVSLLTLSPVVCGTYIAVKQTADCCNENKDRECSKEQTTNKQSDKSDSNSCLSCCSVQNCHCSFVDAPQFNFQIQMSLNSKRVPIKNDKVLSDYLSDCWQPPEVG